MSLPIFGEVSSVLLTVLLIIVNFSFGCAIILGNIPISIQIQTETDEEYRGRVQGVVQSASAAMSPIGMGISGILLDHISPAIIGIGCGIIMCMYIQWFAFYRRKQLQ